MLLNTKVFKKRLMFLVAVILLAPAAHARNELGKFKFLRADCPLRKKATGEATWSKIDTPSPKGQIVTGRIASTNEKYFLFLTPKRGGVFLTLSSCMQAVTNEKNAPVPAINQPYLSLGLLSWKAQPRVTGPDNAIYPLLSTQVGVALGAGINFKHATHLWGLESNFTWARGQIGLKTPNTTDPTAFNYSVNNANVYGFIPSGFFLWTPAASSVAFGFAVGEFFSYSSLPEAGAGYTIHGRLKIVPLFYGETKIQLGNWALVQRIGSYGSTSIFWNLGAHYEI